MGTYYLNLDTSSNPNGDNEVHESSCWRMHLQKTGFILAFSRIVFRPFRRPS